MDKNQKKIESSVSSCLYPLKGIVYMAGTPSLRRIVLHFLAVVTSVSVGTSILAFWFLWNFHMQIISKYFQYTMSARLVTALVLLAEAALPTALFFAQQFEIVQKELFDETLKLQNVQPEKTSEVEVRELRKLANEPPVSPKTIKQPKFLRIVKPLNFLYDLLLVPKLGEAIAVSKMREFANRALGSFLPFLIPLLAYRDSTWLAAHLMRRYWLIKGVTDNEVLRALQGKYVWEYRGFGAVAATLNYVPILNWALGLTNSVGAALLAAKLEQQGIKRS